ncbi:hypothetical protein SAMN04489740_1136 [Arthrobacter alpinus]|uniref:Uncharacterized protein n=1 Tax=Arthrobacter alpinus TaxID=656366 RepID=A0A1H5HXK6_9MICC|nr:hypothetical protein SAMN04489740_1136 [Arthrobacter alpinus]
MLPERLEDFLVPEDQVDTAISWNDGPITPSRTLNRAPSTKSQFRIHLTSISAIIPFPRMRAVDRLPDHDTKN